MTPWLGVVADDVTGACDLADGVREAGAGVVVVLGVPGPGTALPPCDCAVVGLRTRTAPRDVAVAESLAAARWLRRHGAGVLYQKYCSTFDSTDEGMIGPVADALRGLLAPAGGPAVSVGTPATPRSGRTQYQGHLFVGRRLLSDSPLRDHPLTPMRDPDLVAVLGRQTPGAVALVPWPTVATGPDAVAAALDAAGGAGHVLVDALTDADLDTLAVAVDPAAGGPARLLGGAAGFAAALARRWAADRPAGPAAPPLPPLPPVPAGPALVVSGSCSERTREQVAAFGGSRLNLDPLAVAADPDGAVDAVVAGVARLLGDSPVLVSSSAPPAAVRAAQERLGAGRAARVLEEAAGRVAARAVRELGVRRLLVAGGETSGAVAEALGLGALHVGPAAAPGVPWMVPADGPRIALLLKSGNFGAPDLFRTAWEACP